MTCKICGNTKLELVYEGVKGYGVEESFSIERCDRCGVCITSPFYSEGRLKEYYNQQTVAFNGEGGDTMLSDYSENKLVYWKKLSLPKRLRELRRLHPKASSVLEIGCGAGIFLDYLKHNGYKVEGVELSEWGYKAAQINNIKVHNELIHNVVDKLGRYDIVVMYDVIEHSHDPIRDLEIVKSLISPGGVIVLNVPNIGSLASKISGKFWNKLIPPNHLFHFNKKSLRYMLDKVGFQRISIQSNDGSPKEFSEQAVLSIWRSIGKRNKIVGDMLEDLSKVPLKPAQKLLRNCIRATRKVSIMVPVVFYLCLPGIYLSDSGEGIRASARKVG